MHVFGLKTVSWFDVWSIEHFISGIIISSLIQMAWSWKKKGSVHDDLYAFFITLMLISFVWESCEFYMEAGYTQIDVITHWFQGVEFWGNRLVTDQVMMLLGAYVYLKHNWLTLPARAFSVLWLVSHIFFFPDSMYLHKLLGLE